MDRGVYKRIGRFISRKDDIISVVSLKPFSFENLCEIDQVHPDNPNRNLIHAKYHSKKELRTSITKHPDMDTEVRDEQSIAPILQPIDFTIDWRRQQERASKKLKGRSEEDDEYDLEYEQMILDKQMGRVPPPKQDTPSKPVASTEEKASQAKQIAHLNDLEFKSMVQQKPIFAPPGQDLAASSQLIMENAPIVEDSAPLIIHKAEAVTVQPQESIATPELDAMRAYRDVLNHPELAPENVRQQIEEAKSKGYQDGFKQGEEKATVQLQGLAKQVVDNVESLLNELGQLRGHILKGAEQNFREVCQALAEALIEREISVSPEVFKTIVDRIVSESISQDQFKILVHPDLFGKLKQAKLDGISDRIFEDANIPVGQFRIESHDAIVDGNIKQVIADLLAQTNLKLYDDKAS